MKKQVKALITGGILLGFMAGTAIAEGPPADPQWEVREALPGTETPAKTPAPSGPVIPSVQPDISIPIAQGELPPVSMVPQKQVDLRNKRLDARERRAQMIKVRQQTITQMDQQQGLTPAPTGLTPQAQGITPPPIQ